MHPSTDALLSRYVERVLKHYSSLGVELLFERHPKVEEYLVQKFDEDLVTCVCPPTHGHTSPPPS